MAIDPFERPRTADGSIRGLPSILTLRARPPRIRSRPTATLALAALIAVPILAACAPSRPIAPARAPTTDTITPTEFDAGQRARLDRLTSALEKPASDDLLKGVLVRLAFDDAADLDLFVTDPAQESVYFANSPTRSGGRLLEDRRCRDISPRIERVHYADPIPGRYRVGVDFHGRCQDSKLSGDEEKQGLYVVRVDIEGRMLTREGMVTPGIFEVIVLEFDVDEVAE